MTGVGARPPKYVVIVDQDIDPNSQRDVMWALSSRVDAEESVYLVKDRWGSPTDPRIPPEKKRVGDITASSLIFDATIPLSWKDEFPKPTAFSKPVLDEYRKKWASKLARSQ
jgi:4-hydroxy-3-polyprenylbenzoate decarboxylase